MGCYPEPPAEAVDVENLSIDHPIEWEFVTCPECHGSAKVSWIITAGRVPRWLVRGIPFVYRYGIRREFHPTGPRWKSLKIAVGSAYGADLGLWKP